MDQVRWVVFDFGEVLSLPSQALPALAARLGVAPEDFEPAYWAEREAYDRGCPELDYWSAVGDRLGVTVDEAVCAELTDIDVRGWLDLHPESLALVEELSAEGVALALLSNAPSVFGRAVEREPWSRHFRHLLFSGDVRTAKPDARVYAELTRTLAARPQECLFFDDRQSNVDGARAVGLHAKLWTGAKEMRPMLVQLGVPVSG